MSKLDEPVRVQPLRPSLMSLIGAEAIGTFLLVLFGCGAVHTAVLTGAQSGLWQVAIVWGVAIMLAIYTVGGISGAHINPAVTLAFAFFGRLRWSLVLPYVVAQLFGAFTAAAVLFALFGGYLDAKEFEKGVSRGEPGSIVTAMCYGEYFPNPGGIAAAPGKYDATAHAAQQALFPESRAIWAEILGTAILVMVIFAVTDEANGGKPTAGLAAVFIGLTVAALISILAPLTQACFNPARDFGPRLFAYFAGWGKVAIPGLSEPWWLTVYIVAPSVGAVVGAAIYQWVLRPGLLRSGGST